MRVSVTQLRADIYRLIDGVLETGEPLEIERHGRIVRLVPERSQSLAELFPPRPELICGEPGDLAGLDWSGTWTG